MLKKKLWANFQRIVEVFTQKIFNMLSNIWGQKGTGSRIRIRNTAFRFQYRYFPVTALKKKKNVIEKRSHLDRKTVLQIKQARLTDVLQLGAGLAHLRLLEPHLGAGTPAEHSEGSGADFALFPVLLLGHAQVRVVTQTGLTEDGEVRVFPVLPVVGVRAHAGRHGWVSGP
jgi:hypothetical protein